MLGADRDKTTLCDSPGPSVTVLTLKLAFGPAPPPWLSLARRVTFPENPLMLVRVMVEFDNDPADIVMEDSRASSEKSFSPPTTREAVTE